MDGNCTGEVCGLYRYPVKGFTPEALSNVALSEDGEFPCDRIYAVENGASGFDPVNPIHIAKQSFTVLLTLPRLAQVRTRFDELDHVLLARAPGRPDFKESLMTPSGRESLARWLTGFLREERRGELRLCHAPPHRFLDNPRGRVSLINLASVRDLAARLDRRVDPLRFRANVYIDGWPAWSELSLPPGSLIEIGNAEFRVVKPIERCRTTHVDPATGSLDIDLVPSLFRFYRHTLCGLYLEVTQAAAIGVGAEVKSSWLPARAAR